MSSCSSSTISTIAGRGGGIVGQVAVGHDVDVGLDVGEHAADDIALALLPLGTDDGAGVARDLDGAVRLLLS